jgi:hypothetical protein
MFVRQRCPNSAYESRMSESGGPSVFCNISFPPFAFSNDLETKTHNVLLLGPPTAYRIARSGERACQVRQKTLDGIWISKTSLPAKRRFHTERHDAHWYLEQMLIEHKFLCKFSRQYFQGESLLASRTSPGLPSRLISQYRTTSFGAKWKACYAKHALPITKTQTANSEV